MENGNLNKIQNQNHSQQDRNIHKKRIEITWTENIQGKRNA